MREIGNSFQQKDERKTIFELERSLLNGESIHYNTLSQLATATLVSSPLLSKAYGEMQIQSGNLKEGVQFLSSAVKGIAAQGLQRHLLEALSYLAMLQLRTGNLEEARTILLFLREEYEGKQTSDIGAVAHALAKGSYLLDDLQRQSEYVQSAFEQYAKQANLTAYSTLLFDLWSGLVPPSELAPWISQVIWLEQKIKLGQAPKSYIHYIKGMKHYFDSQWEDTIYHFDQLDSTVLGYFYYAISQVYRFRARCRVESMKRTIEEKEINDLIQLLEQYDVDLELQFFAEIVKYEWYSLILDDSRAAEAKQKASIIQHLTQLPYQTRELEALNRVVRQDKRTLHVDGNKPVERVKSPLWRVYCFNRLKFVRDGIEVDRFDWKRKKAQELLIYLLLQSRYEAPRDQVVEILFGDSDDPEKLNNRLYVVLHELRRMAKDVFGAHDAIVVKEGMIRLNERMIEYLDVEHYTTLSRVGEQLWGQDRELASEMFEQATQLYGDLLPEVHYIDWLDQYREVLVEKQVGMLKRLANQAMHDRRFDSAESYILQWITIRPHQEEAHYERIRLLLHEGRKTEALTIYRNWEQICLKELGLPPMAETRALVLEIVK